MNDALREALLKSGKATQEQVRKAVKASENQDYAQRIRDRIERYPHSRKGKPYHYARWYVTRKVPDNCRKVCCLCGDRGLDMLDAALDMIAQCLEHNDLGQVLLYLEKVEHKVLIPFNLGMFSGGRTGDFFDPHPTRVCKPCLHHHVQTLLGNLG